MCFASQAIKDLNILVRALLEALGTATDTATHCNSLQPTATHCNTHSATQAIEDVSISVRALVEALDTAGRDSRVKVRFSS